MIFPFFAPFTERLAPRFSKSAHMTKIKKLLWEFKNAKCYADFIFVKKQHKHPLLISYCRKKSKN